MRKRVLQEMSNFPSILLVVGDGVQTGALTPGSLFLFLFQIILAALGLRFGVWAAHCSARTREGAGSVAVASRLL